MFTEIDLQMLVRTFVYGVATAAPWLLGAGVVIVGLTRGEARRALLSFIRAARLRTAPPALSRAEPTSLLDHIHSLEERLSYTERALLKPMATQPDKPPSADRIVVPPHLLRTPV